MPAGRPALKITKGMRFARLVILALEDQRSHGHRVYRCRCDCGAVVSAQGSDLKRGMMKSCGCLRDDRNSARLRAKPIGLKHGYTANGLPHPLYGAWQSMLQRCENPNSTGFINYGGRGIIVCERWHSFPDFLADMGERPADMSLDRIDNDGNYEPSNCHWATWKEQEANKRQPIRQ